jgi:Secretion system C-terminal sorting domain
MKKYLLLFYLTGIAASFTYSQSLQLSDSTGPIANNSTILKYGLPSADEIVSYVFVKNITANRIPVKVKKVELMALHGTMNLFCWGLCFDTSVFVSPDLLMIDSGVTNTTDFSGHYIPKGVVGISTIRYVFFDVNNLSDTVCVNIDFDTYPLEIHNLTDASISGSFPNPADNMVNFNYSVPQNSLAKVIIRNVLGSIVKAIDITDNSGKLSLNTSELADGVYFYTFLVNGISQVTKKLVIRH